MFLPGEFHRQRSLADYSPRGCKESDTTERLTLLLFFFYPPREDLDRFNISQLESPPTFRCPLTFQSKGHVSEAKTLELHPTCHSIRKAFYYQCFIVKFKEMLSSCLSFNNIQQQIFTKDLLCVRHLCINSLSTFSNLVRFSRKQRIKEIK